MHWALWCIPILIQHPLKQINRVPKESIRPPSKNYQCDLSFSSYFSKWVFLKLHANLIWSHLNMIVFSNWIWKKKAQNIDTKYPGPGTFFSSQTDENKNFYKGGIYHMNIVNLYLVYDSYKCLSVAWTRPTEMVWVVRIKMSITNIIKSLFKPSADVAPITVLTTENR